MPGRGNPWRKGGHIDDTIQSEDIEDGTISEVDLDTALTDKINDPMGGSVDLFTQTELKEDFYYEFPDSQTWLRTFKYAIQVGAGAAVVFDQAQSSGLSGGKIYFEVESTNAGDGAGFKSGNRFSNANVFDLSKNITMRVRSALVNDLGSRFDAVGLADDPFHLGGAGTTLSNFDSSVDEGCYFKSQNGGNWLAVSNSQVAGGQTETDTGIPSVVDVQQNFEIIHEPSIPQDRFFINGVLVATHTTNISVTAVTAFLTNWITVDVNGEDRATEIDLWHVVADR